MFPQYHAAVNVSNVSNVSNVWCCRSSYVQDSSEDDGLVRPAHSHHSTPSHRSSLWSWWWWWCWWWLQRWWWWWSRALNSLNSIAQVIVMVLIMTIVVVMLTIIVMVAIDNDDKRWACKYWYCHTGNQHGAPREASKVPESLRGECCFHFSYDLRSDVKPLFLIWYPISALTGYLIMAQSQVSRLRDRWQSRLLQLQTVKCQQQVSFPSLHIS